MVLELEVWKFCAGFFKNPSRGRTLVLYGNNGTAKTHCAKKVFRWSRKVACAMPLVYDVDGHHRLPDSLFVHFPTMVSDMAGGAWHLVEDCEQADLLIIDELGGEHDPKKIGMEKMGRILNNERQWRIITTNKIPDIWEDAFDRRVASRLFRNSTLIDLTDVPDYGTL